MKTDKRHVSFHDNASNDPKITEIPMIKPDEVPKEAVANLRQQLDMLKQNTLAPKEDADSQFEVLIELLEGQPIGLDLDCIDGRTAVISALKDIGAAQVWNKNNPGKEIQVLDRIVAVNDAEYDVREILELIQTCKRQQLVIRRPRPFLIEGLTKVAGTIGVSLSFPDTSGGMGLLVTEVKQPGPLHEWNSRNPERTVKVNDRIVEVNGSRGDPKNLLVVMQLTEKLNLKILPFQ